MGVLGNRILFLSPPYFSKSSSRNLSLLIIAGYEPKAILVGKSLGAFQIEHNDLLTLIRQKIQQSADNKYKYVGQSLVHSNATMAFNRGHQNGLQMVCFCGTLKLFEKTWLCMM